MGAGKSFGHPMGSIRSHGGGSSRSGSFGGGGSLLGLGTTSDGIYIDSEYAFTYFIIEFIFSIVFILTSAIIYVSKYQPDIIDPLNGVKQFYFKTYVISMITLLVLWLIFYALKNLVKYIKQLLVIFLVFSFLLLFVFAGMRLHYDKVYNSAFFQHEFIKINGNQEIPTEMKLEITSSGANLVKETQEEHYISECLTAYQVFQIRSYILMGVHLGINIIVWGFLAKEMMKKMKEKKIREHDDVIFDEEQNVKY